MTNPKTTQCGVFYQSKKLIEVETGYSWDTIDNSTVEDSKKSQVKVVRPNAQAYEYAD